MIIHSVVHKMLDGLLSKAQCQVNNLADSCAKVQQW